MTYTVHDPRLLFDAVIARLETQTSKPIGDSQAPSDTSTPYAVVYPLTDEPGEGPLDDPHQVANPAFQVTCVGDTREQAQWMQKEVRDALLGWSPTVAGFGTFPVHLLEGSGVLRNDAVQPPDFSSSDRFWVRLSS